MYTRASDGVTSMQDKKSEDVDNFVFLGEDCEIGFVHLGHHMTMACDVKFFFDGFC